MPEPDRIVTASTVGDTPDRVNRFVQRTLTTGVDHMIVFLDAEQPDVRSRLEEHPRVTVVETHVDYWRGRRPSARADRHLVNANVACAALAGAQTVRWLFRLDPGDVLAFDREALLDVRTPAVVLPALEAVARPSWRGGEPRLYKKVPTTAELHALAGLGRIPAPEMRWVFRSPILRATGVRPAEGIRLPEAGADQEPDHLPLQASTLPDAYLLHRSDCTIEEFAEHWGRLDPQEPFHSAADRQLAAAFRSVAGSTLLGEAERRARVAALFDRFVADDVRALRQFGLVLRRPGHRAAQPHPLTGAETSRLETALRDLGRRAKDDFRPVLQEVAADTERGAS